MECEIHYRLEAGESTTLIVKLVVVKATDEYLWYEKQKIIYKPTDDAREIYAAAKELFRGSYDWNKGVRSIGVRCTKLVESDSGEQLSLFTEAKARERDDRLNKAIDDINSRYGSGVIKSAAEAESASKAIKDAGIVTDPFHPEDDF